MYKNYFVYNQDMLYMKEICNSYKNLGTAELLKVDLKFIGNYTFGILTPVKVNYINSIKGKIFQLDELNSKHYERTCKLNKNMKKVKVKVQLKSKEIECFMFVYKSYNQRIELPLKEYFQTLKLVYKELDFDYCYLNEVLSKCIKEYYKG